MLWKELHERESNFNNTNDNIKQCGTFHCNGFVNISFRKLTHGFNLLLFDHHNFMYLLKETWQIEAKITRPLVISVYC